MKIIRGGGLALLTLVSLSGCTEERQSRYRSDASTGQGSGSPDGSAPADATPPECSSVMPCPTSTVACVQSACVEGRCVAVSAEDGTTCDDRMVCTTGDACAGGVCAGRAVVCDDGIACSVDACVEAMGGCVADITTCPCQVHADCDDANACNGLETCDLVQRRCQAGTPVACGGIDDDCNVGRCVAANGTCEAVPRPDGTACDDGDLCTGTDLCRAGVCVGAAPVTCVAQDGCHQAGRCDPQTGVCSQPRKPDGTMCDDGNRCTNGEMCRAGTCASGVAVVCVAQDDCHAPGVCNPGTGRCSNPVVADGTTCNDGLLCKVQESCRAGVCTGMAVSCDDGVACTADSCVETLGGCTRDRTACACQTDGDCDDGNACNGREGCNPQTLTCTRGTAVDCSGLNSACQTGSCNPASGACFAAARPNGTACDDGSACTQTDSCQAGQCTGQNAVVCTASDQCHDAGSCNPQTGQCTNPAKSDGAACNDGNACTTSDVCRSGGCVGESPVVCAAEDQCHTAGTCNPSTGSCSNPNKPNGDACNDGNACTRADSCQAGACTGSNPVVCTAQDQCHTAGTCDVATGVCSNPARANGTACNDGNACTQADTCQAGACQGASPVVCTAMDQCHVAGACDPGTGQCSNPNKPNGDGCNDGNACTQADTCQAGACTGANPVACVAISQCHDAGTCNPGTGACSTPPRANGSLCNDGNVCTMTDVCTNGACAGAAISCNDNVACTTDTCNPTQGCQFDRSMCQCLTQAECDDGNPCNGVETCGGLGTCVAGTPINCTGLDGKCTVGVCNRQSGACESQARPTGTTCDDENACSATSSCQSGVCVGAQLVVCTASDQCHQVGVCNPLNGTCSDPAQPNNHPCNDNNACTGSSSCQGGVCTGANPVVCTASDACHVAGTCDTATGLCSNPNAPAGTGCSDGNPCTQTDACQGGACVGSNPRLCTPSDQCHDAGTCNTTTGACSNPEKAAGTPCNDASACTTGEACAEGLCTGGTVTTCPASDQCHGTRVCDPGTGVCSNPALADGTGCNDGDGCTRTDACNAGVCTGGNPVTCTALDVCHLAGTCSPASGTCSNPNAPNTTVCDDANRCTQTDRCNDGTCAGIPIVCTALDACHTAGTCDTATGVCSNPNATNGTACDDGNRCTPSSACQSGTCTGSLPIPCAVLDQCHTAGVCDPGTGVCSNPVRSGPCDDGRTCSQGDACNAVGTCVGTDRDNRAADWNRSPDDVAMPGPRSVHADTDQEGAIALAGAFAGGFKSDGFDLAVATGNLGAFYARYALDRATKFAAVLMEVASIDGKTAPVLDVRDLAVREDGSFVIVGRVQGDLSFAVARARVPVTSTRAFIASFAENGTLQWIRYGVGQEVEARAVDVFEDGRAMVAGHFIEGLSLDSDGSGKVDSISGFGTWAAYYERNGTLAWVRGVASLRLGRLKLATNDVRRTAGLVGDFTGRVTLPAAKPHVLDASGRDVLFFTLTEAAEVPAAFAVGGDSDDDVGGVASTNPSMGDFAVLAGVPGKGRIAGSPSGTWTLSTLANATAGAHLVLFSDKPVEAALVSSDSKDGNAGVWDVAADVNSGDVTLLGSFDNRAWTFGRVGFDRTLLPAESERQLDRAASGRGLFAARFTKDVKSDWVANLRGNTAGLAVTVDNEEQTPDIIVHPNESATDAGLFTASSPFGDQVVDTLAPPDRATSYFLSHFNSQAEYDYCQ